MVLATAASAQSAAPFGLDNRPSNSSCHAVEPPASADIILERRFPNLNLGGAGALTVMTHPPGDDTYFTFATRSGRVGRFLNAPDDENVTSYTTTLDFTSRVTVPPDGGLIQLVYHPNFPSDPRVFLNYSTASTSGSTYGDAIISSIELGADGVTFDPATEIELFRIPRGHYHQGGYMVFDRDGYLNFGIGDITEQGDPTGNGQNMDTFAAKVMRVDVDRTENGKPYAIPDDNPFKDSGGSPLEEIFASGLRNPYKGDMDPVSFDAMVGDVGWTSWEEVSRVTRGANLGWDVKEGFACKDETYGDCEDPTLVDPLVAYPHSGGKCAIIGGYFYRGTLIPELQGKFLYGDFCTGMIAIVDFDETGQPFERKLINEGQGAGNIHGWGKDADGEIYVLNGTNIYAVLPNEATTGPAGPAQLLSETGCFDENDPSVPAPGLVPFAVSAELWSDGATKNRWIALPDGEQISILPDGDFEFPNGTVLAKEFSIDGQRVETRLLQNYNGSWNGFSYEWIGNEAYLLPDAKEKELPNGQIYRFPSRGECLRCHTGAANIALGPSVEQLNADYVYPSTNRVSNQLETLAHIDMFSTPLPAPAQDLPATVGLDDAHHSTTLRARSYLHANCSGCHRGEGPTQSQMDLRFTTPRLSMNVCGVIPSFGDLGIPNAQLLKPGLPAESLIHVRDGSRDPLIQMPPLGTKLPHDEALAVIAAWIDSPSVCDVPVDDDADGIPNDVDNCPSTSNSGQFDFDRDQSGDACDTDDDNDGLTDEQESELGTDPFNSDTDGDGASDGDEVSAGTDPLDPADSPTTGDPDLVAWFRFDSDTGGLILDNTNNGNDGSCNPGATCGLFVPDDGNPNGAYDLRGDGNWVQVSNEQNFDFTSNFTVAFWMKSDDLGRTWAQFVGKGDSAWSVDRAGTTNQLQFTTWSSGPHELIGSTNVADGQWHHVAAVYDGTRKVLYIDGVVDAQTNFSSTLETNNVQVRLGYNAEYSDGQYSGLLDDVRIYQRGLTQSEVAALMTPGTPPAPTIESPAVGSTFVAGTTISFTGSATDADDGDLAPGRLSWQVVQHEGPSSQQVLQLDGAAGGAFDVPTTGLDSLGSIQYEIRLTATDSDGLSTTVSTFMNPSRVTLRLESSPAGLDLGLDGMLLPSPVQFEALVGYEYVVSAPDDGFGSSLFIFSSWSDGGAQTHTITAPASTQTITAAFTETPLDPVGDEDNDQMMNGYEIQFGFDPFDPSDADLDLDNDELSNLEEQSVGTDPTVFDTDGDGAGDGQEVSAGTDPLDPASTPDLTDPDLVAWYRFDSDTGSTVVDSSGNGNDGQCSPGNTCPIFVSSDGRPAGSANFTGNGNFVELANESEFDFSDNFTVVFWMRTAGFDRQWAQLVGKGDSAWSVDRAGNSNTLQFTTWSPGFDELIGQTNVADNSWHHVAVVYDGSSKVLYVDGSVDAQASFSESINNNNVSVRLGFNTEYPSGEYGGMLDDVRIYSRALTIAEIQQILNEASP